MELLRDSHDNIQCNPALIVKNGPVLVQPDIANFTFAQLCKTFSFMSVLNGNLFSFHHLS